MPPLRNDTSDGEKKLRHMTEESIAKAAHQQALEFLAGPASFLVENSTTANGDDKLKKIYQEAATHAYTLWTRRTEMRCYTLREIRQLTFDAESPRFDADPLLRY